MARIARIVLPGYPHHVTQGGTPGQPVFPDRQARQHYLDLLQQHAEEHQLDVYAYSLLNDRVHLVVVPKKEESLAMTLRRTHSSYGRYLNARENQSGTVWHGRFASCPMDREWVWAAVKYVERAPVEERLARKPEAYAWSSAPARCGKKKAPVLSPKWPDAKELKDWAKWLAEPQPEEEAEIIEAYTRRGYVLGSDVFRVRIEKKLGGKLPG